jgi:two-component system response regulator FixJ
MSPVIQENEPLTAALVCIVDPDAALAQRLSELLAAAGAQVRVFGSGAALLAEAAIRPACVISELRLPDMTGIELIGALRARQVQAPVILLAGDGDVAAAVAAMRAGALDFIEKPHVDRLLAWHVRRLLENDEPGAGPARD